MKVFLDVGAHEGETLEVAIGERWGFDQIHSFEPAKDCWESLESIASLAGDRVTVHRFGLWSCDSELTLHDPGSIGASLMDRKATSDRTSQIQVRDAARWFSENLSLDDEVVVKINCEGAEYELLLRLIESGEISKVNELLVHFDLRKIPGMGHLEAPLRECLVESGVPYRSAEQVMFGRNVKEKTSNWLSWYHAGRIARGRYSHVARAIYAVRVKVYWWRAARR